MAEIVNLRRARKTKGRAEAAAAASASRAAHGRTKAEKQLAKAAADQLARTLDGAKRD